MNPHLVLYLNIASVINIMKQLQQLLHDLILKFAHFKAHFSVNTCKKIVFKASTYFETDD